MAGIVHGGGLTAAVARYGGRAEDWLDLSTGINPCPPALPDLPMAVWNRLPDAGLDLAARKAARRFYLGSDDGTLPVAVPGTQSFIQFLPLVAPVGRPVAIVSPTYGEYAHCFKAAGFAVEAIASVDQIEDRHGAVIVVNPNNPDGRIAERATLLQLAARLQESGGHLHVDEAFGDSAFDQSVAAHAGSYPNLSVSRSFGKYFGMAGVRLGFVFADPDLMERLAQSLGPWPVSGPALAIAERFLSADRSGLDAVIAERHHGLIGALNSADLEILGGTSLFALVRHPEAGALYEHLANHHILVRKFDYAPTWLRIGLAPDQAADQHLAGILKRFSSGPNGTAC
ncbi:threonine-phosphate decarboxylase CobD [Rhizobium alvei]|uniref:threonine-phosphate decarboxylase n=1 Tax=Rhizobium alvei TaxID=1132659 RepID=A0ABT8YHZ1_9HYPH|nr:threonine-phosphate decarboxylase CobD [Rhizobium alvei]MDO6963282.1 threonine-phosphate decarboxylase CobD [Rhizobium alvei]